MPYLPEQLYADLRRLSMFRDQLNEDRIRSINRLHRELKIYFPEYKEALGKTEGTFSLELLKRKGQILRSTPNTAPLICGACNTQPEGLLTMA